MFISLTKVHDLFTKMWGKAIGKKKKHVKEEDLSWRKWALCWKKVGRDEETKRR